MASKIDNNVVYLNRAGIITELGEEIAGHDIEYYCGKPCSIDIRHWMRMGMSNKLQVYTNFSKFSKNVY